MKLRVLVIEDDECILDTSKMYLEDLGHEVTTASDPTLYSGCKGFKCEQDRTCFDLMLIDYNMPRMTGLEFLKYQSDRGCKTPPSNKIIISGNTHEIDIEKVQQLGCRVVQKPMSFDHLDVILSQVIAILDPKRKLPDLPNVFD